MSLCFILSVTAEFVFGLPYMTNELMLRNTTTYSNSIHAIVSGAAGIVSFTTGIPTSIV
ncbi:DUF389 domain-containing protein [uncultured Pseudodesulfovibrio sp.]|uniref:DUF389 domain-containing protein n=1 Tax=uncultured Pseudodesulfovibrio sp. TaxID=2035858 RepID=UPI0037495943